MSLTTGNTFAKRPKIGSKQAKKAKKREASTVSYRCLFKVVQAPTRHTYLRHGDIFILHDGQERHLDACEHSELPGQAQHHCEHEAALHRAADQRVGVQRHRAAHSVHVRVQAGGEAS